MTYSSGGLIQATDYNSFVSTGTPNVNATWSTLYGQTALTTVSTGGTVSALQWSNLNTDVYKMGQHQGTAVSAVSGSPVAGDLIAYIATLSTDITNTYNNRFNAASQGSQYTTFSGTVSKTTNTGSGSSPWTITFTSTVTFASAIAATSFFNAGGLLKIQFNKQSTGTVADTEWNTFIGSSGAGGTVASAVYLSSDATSKNLPGFSGVAGTFKSGGTGTPTTLASGTGFNQLTSSPTTIYQQFDSGSAYSSNYVQITAAYNSSTFVLTLVTTWYDNGDANPGSTAQITGGTATTGNPISWGTAPATLVTYIPPESTNLSPTWGTPSINGAVA